MRRHSDPARSARAGDRGAKGPAGPLHRAGLDSRPYGPAIPGAWVIMWLLLAALDGRWLRAPNRRGWKEVATRGVVAARGVDRLGRDSARSRPVSGCVYPGNRSISTGYATHTSCSASIGHHPMIRNDPGRSRFVPDINTSGRPQRRAHSLSAWSLGRAPARACGRPRRPPRRRVCRDLGRTRPCGLGAGRGAPTGDVRPPAARGPRRRAASSRRPDDVPRHRVPRRRCLLARVVR